MKIKTILIGVAILLVMIFFATVKIQANKIKKLKEERARLELNYLNAVQDAENNSLFLLKEKELTKRQKEVNDSLAKALKVKPKFIDKIVYETVTVTDTVSLLVPVQYMSKDFWLVTDTGKCFVWKAEARLTDDSLSVKRTDFTYHNLTTEVFYRRRPFNFWFIHLGKAVNIQQKSMECGEYTTKTFEFVR
jgi:plasmid maintenance system antidote protein VapI